MKRSELLASAAAVGALAAAPPAGTRDVALVTALGTIVVRLELRRAPVTAGNFLHHVQAGDYRNASFYRAVGVLPPAAGSGIIQGGIGSGADRFKPIPIERTTKTGLHNTRGAISMARTNDPNSATTEFFICTGDDREYDADKDPDGAGYAVFGYVVRGMPVAYQILEAKKAGEYLTPPVPIERVRVVSG